MTNDINFSYFVGNGGGNVCVWLCVCVFMYVCFPFGGIFCCKVLFVVFSLTLSTTLGHRFSSSTFIRTRFLNVYWLNMTL